jgi:cytidylate kinase
MGPARRPRPIVAIDGPAGAGKSTVARRLADALGFVLVDTGAMYRAVALAAERAGVAWTDPASVSKVALSMVADRALRFDRDENVVPQARAERESGRNEKAIRVHLANEDVTEAIRAPNIGMGASTVSAYKGVRDALLAMQREAGRQGGVVLEGRDVGTVVFPDAEVKFFLTARPDVRARRRYDELQAKGASVTLEDTLADVHRRDQQDTMRALAPLRRADDAILIDNSDFSIDQTVAQMIEAIRERSAH